MRILPKNGGLSRGKGKVRFLLLADFTGDIFIVNNGQRFVDGNPASTSGSTSLKVGGKVFTEPTLG